MLNPNIESYAGTLSLVGLAIIATFVGVQNLVKNWRSTAAETNIITLMHTELERMSAQNQQLSTELGRLHSEIIALNQELQKLTIENQSLQLEVVALTNEIAELKQLTKGGRNGKIAIN